MSIDRSILSEFIKATNDNKETKQTQLYGTVVTQGNSKCVKIDGSEIVTPVRSITDIKDDERVMVSIKDHMATVTGNMTNPSVGNDRVESAEGKIDRFDHLFAGNITAENIAADSITADKILAGAITTDKLMAESIIADKIAANAIESKHIKADTIESNHIKTNVIEAEHIKAGVINAEHITSGTITADKIQSGSITAGSGIIADGAIGNAQISKIDAAKIEAGTIDTSKVTIQGSNGHLRLKGNRMQVFDGVGTQAKERVSVGDINGDGSIFGLRVRGADGQTILLDENGVKSEGITDGSITNDKISEDANIDGAKLNINSVINKINIDGTETIQGTKIEVDGTTLETKLYDIKMKQDENGEKITQAQSQITANTNAIKLKVDEQTYTMDKKDMTIKLEKNTSEISAMKGQIALKVEQTDIENAKSEMEGTMDSKIEGLQVGGRNIFKNSGFTQGTSSWDIHSCNNLQVINEPLSISKKAINFVSTGGGIYQRNIVGGEITALPNGENYTVSGYVKCSSTAELRVALEGVTTKYVIPSSANAWVYFSHQFTGNGTAHTFTFYGVNGNVYTLKDLKLEKGNKPTDWTPAPEDVDGVINSVDSKVDTLRTEYNSTKSKVATIETNLSGITSRVSSAETNIEKISNASSQNLLYNSDFRIINGSLPDGWSVSDSSKITLDRNDTLLDGIPTFWFNVTGLTENTWKAVYSPFIEAKAGEKFVASAYVIGYNKWSTLDNGASLEIEYYNDSSRISTVSASVNKSNLNWQRLVVKGTAPTGTTRVRIRVHPIKNGQFNMSKPMLQYGETVTGWDRGFDIKNLTTRLTTAESKITESAITNTVKKNFYTKTETDSQITSKGYQTSSQVQQTVNGLEVKVKQSGGYNNLFNSGFKKGTSYWSEHLYGTATNKSISTWDDGNQYILPNTKALVIRATNPTDRYGVHQNVKVKEGATYSISALSAGHRNTKQLITIRKASDGTHIANIEANPIGAGKNINNWRKMEGIFTIPSGCTEITVCLYMVGTGNNSDAYVWYTNVLLSEGKLVNEWSPHPSEIYDGVTTIDKDGVTVTASNVKSKTNMSANGFKITKTDTNTDVFKVNSDGTLYMEGEISLTSSKGIKGKTTRKIVIANDNYCVYDGTETDVNRKVFMGFRPYNSNAQYIPSVMLGYNGINPNVDGAVVSGGTYTTYSHYPNNNNPESINLSYGALAFKYGASGTQFSTLNMYQNGDIDLKAGSGIYFRPNLRAKDNHVFGISDTEVGSRVPFKCTSTIYSNGDITTDRGLYSTYLSVQGNAGVSNKFSASKLVTNRIDVYGDSNLDGNTYISGSCTISNTLNVRNRPIYGMGSITLDRGTIYLPQGGGNTTTDYVRIGFGIIAGVSSGNFHFLTMNASPANLYASNVRSAYSLEPNSRLSDISALEQIDAINVVSTSEGLRLSSPNNKFSVDESKVVTKVYNEKTNQEEINVDYNSAISTLWKAIQELKQENDELKKMIKEL